MQASGEVDVAFPATQDVSITNLPSVQDVLVTNFDNDTEGDIVNLVGGDQPERGCESQTGIVASLGRLDTDNDGIGDTR